MQKQITEKSFEGQTIYAGMDVHKKNWKVTILTENMEHKQFNQDPNAELLAKYLKRNFPGASYKAVYEAGFSGFGACRKLRDLGVDCMVIHPSDVPTTQNERLQKTDSVDSRKLAKSLRAKEFKGIDIPDVTLELDRSLIRQRGKLVKELARYKNRVKSLLMQLDISIPENFSKTQSRYWSGPYIKWLQSIEHSEKIFGQVINNYIKVGQHLRAEILSITNQIKELSNAERYSKKFELIKSIPGFGNSAGMYFLVQLGNIKRFKSDDELNYYVGLVPKMYGSGDKMHTGKLVRRGRKEMKIMLIEASWIAIRKDPAMMLKFNELALRMHKNNAIIRIARKLLNRVRYVLTHEEGYTLGVVD